ncbi:hypothetical protein J057_17350 [Marinobacter nanhaiticus D15-8W]|uniref:Uncharacterized protein n=1 Tax=Marinobacter nanhaiticus D15-8W TaxID=626887 RepID=N6VZ83_9GAMM|nr:hypothetical protein J057_17350 [Marinobacter nanhaiticus D15-8W]
MPRLIRDAWVVVGATAIGAFSQVFAAPGPTPGAYLSSKPLVLEVRYCECAATDLSRASDAVLPSFLETSKLLKVGAFGEDEGFVSSDGFSMGYGIKQIEGGRARFLFTYSAEYTIDADMNAGHGELLVNEGQWVQLFGSSHTTNTGAEYTGVAIRLVKTDL